MCAKDKIKKIFFISLHLITQKLLCRQTNKDLYYIVSYTISKKPHKIKLKRWGWCC